MQDGEDVNTRMLALAVIFLYTGNTFALTLAISQREMEHPYPARDTMPTAFISYSQVSADQFIAAALTWFGDPDPAAGSPRNKGKRLEYIGTLW